MLPFRAFLISCFRDSLTLNSAIPLFWEILLANRRAIWWNTPVGLWCLSGFTSWRDSTCPESLHRRPPVRPIKSRFRTRKSACGPMRNGCSAVNRPGRTCKIGWKPSANCKSKWPRWPARRPRDAEDKKSEIRISKSGTNCKFEAPKAELSDRLVLDFVF